MPGVDPHRQGLGLEPITIAGLARRLGLEAAEFLADPGGIGLAPATLEVGQDPLEGLLDLVLPGVVVVDKQDLRRSGSPGNLKLP